ncbi:hypothetical protein N7468_009168 [Penicillium chermesinum]|uniref:Uncharacterized protein n=1 Tax=Penicillium chermesinum TaxID=63820 RepID=A0A9W9TF07_9EURO|nr:uncharacterized protein N7468_009168 [Penicillium chermesinum]KAJ5219964.1 hypothetical protein N7468_009168 [Penicillium chermesinum]KAJ6157423.1 hypothetical protein N7470_005015 [Penicillium chermesinum]
MDLGTASGSSGLALDSLDVFIGVGGPAYRTDLEDSHPHIVLEERTFSGKLWFDRETKTVYREIDPAEPQYFGPPGPEIDRAWGDLLRGEFVRLTPEEAAPYLPDLTVEPASGHYHFEPDMFHSLHCLNAVRKELDKDYYSKLGPSHLEMEIQNSTAFPPDWGRIHMDHCLDQLRQAIQCQGDLSPVPLYHHEGMSIGLGVGQTHTCRKWEPMRHWMDERKMRQLKDKAQ